MTEAENRGVQDRLIQSLIDYRDNNPYPFRTDEHIEYYVSFTRVIGYIIERQAKVSRHQDT